MKTVGKIIFFILLSFFISVPGGYCQLECEADEVVVTASRIYTEYRELLRNVTVIDSKQISNMPSSSISDILNYQVGVDIQHRGYQGVHGDVNMRGSSFEQVLVLVDGIRINDSQTAHHNLDIPINPSDIERIEILQGHGSSVYGPSAFGGVINIISKQGGKSPFKISASTGDFELLKFGLSKAFSFKKLSNLITINNNKSSGYRYDTEFERFSIYSKTQYNSDDSKLSFSVGYLDNDFGASNFYGFSPSSEHTKTFLASLTGEFNDLKRVSFEPKIFLKRHKDHFIYDIRDPEIYISDHTKYKTGGELTARINLSRRRKLIAGTEVIRDNIESNKLGNHNISRMAIFAEYGSTLFDRFMMNIGIRGDYQSNYSLGWYPSFNAGYLFPGGFKIRSSIGKCFRIPSFTELYYKSPSNTGNPYLKPEKGWSYELGFDYFSGGAIKLQTNLYLRKQEELIDWISEDSGKHWEARNIGRVDIKGIENILKISLYNENFFYLKYSYNSGDFKKGYNYTSKYVFRFPVHQCSLESNWRLPFNTNSYFAVVLKKRRDEKKYIVFNANFSKRRNNITYFLKIMNIFNAGYEEILGLPAPGRWLESGIMFEI